MVVHLATQRIFWIYLRLPGPAWGCFYTGRGLGLRMVKNLEPQLVLGVNERRKTGSLPMYDIMHRWGAGGFDLRQIQS